jgi:hypothetical protein
VQKLESFQLKSFAAYKQKQPYRMEMRAQLAGIESASASVSSSIISVLSFNEMYLSLNDRR